MQRLNIPFDRYHRRTTRRTTRRVVWMGVFPFLLFGIGSWLASELWFSRTSTVLAMPDATEIAITLRATHHTKPFLVEQLETVPLITNRSMTVSQLLPITEGELTVFFHTNGDSSVAIRSEKDAIPYELLDAFGITVTEHTPSIFLLSHKPLTISETQVKAGMKLPNLNPMKQRIGTLHLAHENKLVSGPIFTDKQGIHTRIPTPLKESSPYPESLHSDVFAALSTPVLPNTHLDGLITTFSPLTSWLNTPHTPELLSAFINEPGYILLSSKKAQSPGFLLQTTKNTLSEDDQMRLLRTVTALKSPSLREYTLPDQTIVGEIVIDPAFSTIEEKTLLGSPVKHTSAATGEEFFMANRDSTVVFTNQESLLTHWLSEDTELEAEHRREPSCGGKTMFLDMQTLYTLTNKPLQHRIFSASRLLSEHIPSIGVTRGKKYTQISLCNP